MKETDSSHEAVGGSDGLRGIKRILKAMSADMIHLVVVEARLFGHTVLWMIALTVVIALLLVCGWLFSAVALVMALTDLQAFSLTGALLTVALAHLVLAALAFWRLRYITRDLRFRESWATVNSMLTLARSLVGNAGTRTEEK